MTACIQVAHRPIPALGIEVQTWHLPGGAVHYHLANDDGHRAFTIAFRTPPENDAGTPHILEHTVLCGSQLFPVRDPFFAMLRRSLATYLNAITYPDITCYPFATQIERDYDHLLAVYLDAVFNPQLDVRDFAQEGHRLSFNEAGQPTRMGVVFNEMKGAYASSSDHVERAIARHLLPNTSARYDSGGLPEHIPELSHEVLVASHRQWYVPANACIVTYGKLDLTAFHAVLSPYLDRPGQPHAGPALQAPMPGPRRIEVPVPIAEDESPTDVGFWSQAWIVGDGNDLAQSLDLDLLDELLLGHAGAPLRLALESSGLGRSTAGSGVDSQFRTLLFRTELDGIDPADYDRVGPLVERTLRRCERNGFSAAARKSALHQLELAHRDLEGDEDPFGLSCCLQVAHAWNADCDPAEALDLEAPLAALGKRWADPEYGVRLLRELLLNNSSRAEIRAMPQASFHEQAERREAEHCWSDLARMGTDGPRMLHADQQALHQRQTSAHDFHLLPTLTIADIPTQRTWSTPDAQAPWIFTPRSNGLLSRIQVFDASSLADDFDLLPLLVASFGELGVGKRGYAAQAKRINRRSSGVSGWFNLDAVHNDPDHITMLVGIETQGLAKHHGDLAALLDETIAEQRFHEYDRLRELIEQDLQELRDDLPDRGNVYAAWAARARLGGAGALDHALEGIGHLTWLRAAAASDDDALEQLAARLQALLMRLRHVPTATCFIGDRAGRIRTREGDATRFTAAAIPAPAPFVGVDTAYTVSSSVGHQARVVRTVPMGHPDAPTLAVASHMLTQRYLLPRLREQGGAYGASASYNPVTGTFACTSYRDPRTAATVADLDAASEWLVSQTFDDEAMREGILATIGEIDAPQSPSSEATDRFLDDLRGQDMAWVDAFRRDVLAVTAKDIVDVGQRWLQQAIVVRAAVLDENAASELTSWHREAL